MSYHADTNRYDGKMVYRRTGRSGLDLPVLSLGYWHNFGDDRKFETQREIARRAFDLGITHHDLANNYGPPYGAAETNFGRLMKEDFRPYRDEMVISTKAGWDMWPGPYGQGGGGRKYVLSSLDQSLARMNLDYVDIFYSHRLDGSTPLEETMGALDTAVRQGKALYVGISSYDAEHTREAAAILADLGTPLLIHQPQLLDAEPLDRGRGPARDGRRARHRRDRLHRPRPGPADRQIQRRDPGELAGDPERLRRLRKRLDQRRCDRPASGSSNAIAEKRGQSLPQMALAWSLRDPRMTSLVIGASSTKQLEQNVDALDNLDFTAEELAEIDRIVDFESNVDVWADARAGKVGSGI